MVAGLSVENRVLAAADGGAVHRRLHGPRNLSSIPRIRGRTLAEARLDWKLGAGGIAASTGSLTQKVIAAVIASSGSGGKSTRAPADRCAAMPICWTTALRLEDLDGSGCCSNSLESKREVIDLLGRAETADAVALSSAS